MDVITAKRWIKLAAFNGLVAVLCGAWGAHGLQDKLGALRIEAFKTAAYYQMVHALLLLILALLIKQQWLNAFFLNISAALCMVGIVLFSGSLYLLSLSDFSWLGLITPVGGLALLASWGVLAYAAAK